jgi:WhiB family redox-sensing transcriptional regulator
MALAWQTVDTAEDIDEARYECDPGELIDATSFVADLTRRPAWAARASCRGQGADKWWPARGVDVRPLRAVCAGCPVQAECRAEALARPSHTDGGGIWGGTSERERRQLRRAHAA